MEVAIHTCSVAPGAFANLVAVVSESMELTWIIPEAESGTRTRATGIFPFCLGGEAIAVRALFPANGILRDYVRWLKAMRLTELVAKTNAIKPGNVFKGPQWGKAATRVGSVSLLV